MKRAVHIILITCLVVLCLTTCNSSTDSKNDTISTDQAVIAKGEATFIQFCSSCHNFRQGGIGPSLAGLLNDVPAKWVEYFLRDPQKVIKSGDERAQKLFRKYKTVMPSFSTFSEDEMKGIIAFLNTHSKPGEHLRKDEGKGLSNPITDSIRLSSLVVNLKLMVQMPASSDSGKFPLTRITKLDFQPTTGSLFIADIRGKLYKLQNNKAIEYMDMARLRSKLIVEPGYGTGLGSFAFHPDFMNNGILYTSHTEAPASAKADFAYADSIKVTQQWVLTEWKTGNPKAATFSGTSRELLRVNMVSVMHGIQEIAFNPLAKSGNRDYGMLYVCIGDGGSVDEGYPFLAHSKEKIWGTILRIDPRGQNGFNGKFGIPADNPFVKSKNPKELKEIYAYGFRNPHRISWTRSGEILVCNIGGSNIESVDLIKPGHDYGWPMREGTFVLNPYGDLTKVYPLPSNDSIYNFTYPIAQYGHGKGWTGISGGFEYWGTSIPQLKGKFIFGDIPSGRLFYIEMADIKLGRQAPIKEWKFSIDGHPTTFKAIIGRDRRVDLRFGRDMRGELYILTKPDGKIYELVSAKN